MARAQGDAPDSGEHMFVDAAEPMVVAEDAEEDADGGLTLPAAALAAEQHSRPSRRASLCRARAGR